MITGIKAQNLLDDFNSGMKITDISKKYHVAFTDIYKVCGKRNERGRTPKIKELSDDDIKTIKQMFNDKVPKTKIAQKFNMSVPTLTKILRTS